MRSTLLLVLALAGTLLAGCTDDAPEPEAPMAPAPKTVQTQVAYASQGHPGTDLCVPVACVFAVGREDPTDVRLGENQSLVALDLHVEWPAMDPDAEVTFSIQCRAENTSRGCGTLAEHTGPAPFDIRLEGLMTPPGAELYFLIDTSSLLEPVEAMLALLGEYEYDISGTLTVEGPTTEAEPFREARAGS